VGPRAVLDAVVKRKILSPRRESNPRIPIVQPVAPRYTDRAIIVIIIITTTTTTTTTTTIIVYKGVCTSHARCN
jgi:hypothetical protein